MVVSNAAPTKETKIERSFTTASRRNLALSHVVTRAGVSLYYEARSLLKVKMFFFFIQKKEEFWERTCEKRRKRRACAPRETQTRANARVAKSSYLLA